MTDRLDELQRLHDRDLDNGTCLGCTQPAIRCRCDERIVELFPALLRVARAAQKVIGGTFDPDELRPDAADLDELHAALAELRGTT